jgi:hypothetical protein
MVCRSTNSDPLRDGQECQFLDLERTHYSCQGRNAGERPFVGGLSCSPGTLVAMPIITVYG